ncbi:hypothetical protein MMC06_002479 [Schaereria dolodes]|nr:hypothetical protein [Schaereria dolodes]
MILCLRAVRALAQATRPQAHHSQPRSTASALLLRRTFTGRIPLRPSLIIPAHASYALPQELSPSSDNWAEPSAGRHLDLVPKISSHPALAGIQSSGEEAEVGVSGEGEDEDRKEHVGAEEGEEEEYSEPLKGEGDGVFFF